MVHLLFGQNNVYEMSIIYSASASNLTFGSLTNSETMTHIKLNNESCNENKLESISNYCNSLTEDIESNNDYLLTSKAQTLDRFSRPSSINPHGEKRKKSFFASFRLSKKSFGKGKDDQRSSWSDLSPARTDEKSEEIAKLNQGSRSNDATNYKQNDEANVLLPSKPRKHYLNRMSSFVNKVANKVQGTELNAGYGLRHKLERSQTVTGTDLMSSKVDYVIYDEKQTPGLMGIRNHGNTCFINAVIQCLCHTDILAEYFVLDQYKNDLARCNRINSKKFGTRGEITEHLAILLKSLWVLRYVPDISLNLKNVIEKYEPCYRGSNQHDAAEFLMFILDKVHEDLNTASKRKYKKVKNSYGRPDEIVAAETLANHLRCNSSFIQDIFQAQFRSSLKCPHCLKESNTFDPYLCVSIPIPQIEVLSVFVTVIYLNQQPKQVKIAVPIEASSTIKHLRSMIAADCGINNNQLVLTEVDGEGFHRTFYDNACVNIIQSTDPIYAIELTSPDPSCMLENGVEEFLHIMWMNVLIVETSNIRFGGVYQSQISRDVTYPDLQKLLLKEMSTIISMDTLTSEQTSGIFSIGVDNGTKSTTLLEHDLDLPLLHQCVDESLSICHPLAGPRHIKLVLQWTEENKIKYIIDDIDHIEEHSSVEELKKKPPEYAPVTLRDCLQLHTSAEMLSCGDAWHCPTCNRKQQVLKKLNLWSAPQVLVIHLKRFKQVSLSSNSSKLNTIVNFPLNGFDISDHMAGRHFATAALTPSNVLESSTASNKVLNGGGVWSPWKRSKKFNTAENEHVYDLYAICNHHGRDLQGGHYTAVCRNPTSGKWYTFDDFNIEEIHQDNVIGQDAYILFYQKREEPLSPRLTWESESNHWSYRIPLTVLPSQLKIIPSTEDKEDIEAAKTKDSETNSEALECVENSTSSDASIEPLGENKLSPSDETVVTSSIKDPKSKIGTSFLKGDTIEKNEIKAEVIQTLKQSNASTTNDKCSLDKNDTDCDKLSPSNEAVQKIIFVSDKEMSTSNSSSIDKNLLTKENSVASDDDQSEGSVPEIRIQPASLEVLASHRYRSSIHGVIKAPLRQNGLQQEDSNSEDNSPNLSDNECETRLTNEFEIELSSRGDEETPQVRITKKNQSPTLPHNSYKSNHRMSNANKTPSFVVIRTPSPRISREKAAVLNGESRVEASSMHGVTHKKTRDTYPGPDGKQSSSIKDKRPASYDGGQRSEISTRKNTKNYDKRRSTNAHYETINKISCVMECDLKKGNHNQFITESSV